MKPKEGSAAEEATESPAAEKVEDAGAGSGPNRGAHTSGADQHDCPHCGKPGASAMPHNCVK